METGFRNWMRKKVRKRQEKKNANAVVGESARQEQKEGSSVAPQPIAPTSGPKNVDQETSPPQGTAFQASAPTEIMETPPTTSQLRPSTAGRSNAHEEGPPTKTEHIASTMSPITIAHDGSPQTAPQETPMSMTETLRMPAKEEAGLEGGILNNAQGVHIGGSATLISARNYTNVYNTIVQPDISEKDMALFEKIVEWLSDINYHAIQADNYGKRAEGTGEWAFDDPKIVDWMGGSLGVLWGVGMPGAGKTVLASIIINHLLQKAKANKRIFVAFAFSRYTDQFTGDKVLGGLLRQVVQDHPSTLAFVKPMYDYHHQRKTRPSQKELLDVIRAIFNSDLFDEKFCALDGLDEAFEDTQVDVLDALASLPANLLLMSRPLPLLKDRVPDALFIDIILHEADIIQMIENKIGHMPRLHNLLEKGDWKKKVVKTVLDKSTGMFLLASLQLDMLGSCINIKSLNTALQVLPEGVNAMYEVTMERINSGLAPKLALGALTLLAYACESLKMDDLLHALAVETEPFKYDSNLLVDSDTVLSACCGLITFEPETKLVRLVHYTAQDFLVTHLSKVGVNAEAVLACTCVARLQSCGFANYNGSIDDYDDNIFTYHPFLAYAHRNWAIHAHSASLPAFVEEFILQCQHIPWKHPFYEDFNHLNPIQLAAACNFHSLLAQWLGLDPSLPTYQPPFPFNINSKSANGHTALALAAVCGHLKTVELLIEVEGVDTQCFDSRGWSPLIAASREGHVQVVDLLLGVVDADHVNAGSWTALMHAVFSGKTEVMKSLLCVQGIHVNAILPNTGCREGYSALIFAAGNGQLDAVRLLLEVDGIDVNASFSRCGTALVVATREEYTDIVKLLLQQEDINVNSSSQCTQGSALMQAAYWGYKDMVKLLLQQEEIDVNATRPDGHSALSLALKKIPCKPNKPRLEIAELLQAHGAQ